MRILGLTKTTLLDYPGRIACTVFTGNCNLRCLYCHNTSLVLHPNDLPSTPEEEFFSFLEKRRGMLQGVCITGGEPTLSDDLAQFIKKIKDFGYPVKLDTNGFRPDVLKELVKGNLIDMAAVDVKTDKKRYPQITGIKNPDLSKLDETIAFLKEGRVEYEFRTTVVSEFFDEEAAHDIGLWLKGAKALFLQQFIDSKDVAHKGLHGCTKEEMLRFAGILKEYIEKVELRGID